MRRQLGEAKFYLYTFIKDSPRIDETTFPDNIDIRQFRRKYGIDIVDSSLNTKITKFPRYLVKLSSKFPRALVIPPPHKLKV